MKVAIVTGASRGIGRACALRLARDGYTVVINYAHREDEARAVLDAIEAAGGAGMLCQADVSDPAAVRAMMRDVSKAYGQIDLLVNNAGIVRDEYLLMLTPETLDQCLDLNVKGYLYCAQQAVLKMFRKKSGAIINMSSVSGTFALAGQTVYSATKGAVNAMTRTMAKELLPTASASTRSRPALLRPICWTPCRRRRSRRTWTPSRCIGWASRRRWRSWSPCWHPMPAPT